MAKPIHQRRSRGWRLLLALAALLPAAPAAQAEYVVLRNGQRMHVTGYERAGDIMRLYVAGGVVTVATENVVAIEAEEVFPLVAEAAPTGPFGDLIRDAAERHGVDEHLITSVIAVESNFNPRAVSRKRARGLMQLMPATAKRFEVKNVFDPAQNIEAGTRYLKELLDRYHQDPLLALAAYNAGPQRVEQYGGVPPFAETMAYLRRVLNDWRKRKTELQ